MKKIVLTLTTLVTAFMLMLGMSTVANAASGKGWKTLPGITKIDKHATYYITFDDKTARSKLTPYVKIFAADLHKSTGVTIKVTTTIEKIDKSNAPKYHHWVLDYRHKPTGVTGQSVTYTWHADGFSWGGYSFIDSEMWDWKLAKYRIANIVTHEGGHMIGLAHPNKVDSKGKPIRYACPKYGNPARYPVMCSPNGGYQSNANGGKFTYYDRIGLRQMVANAS